jgi:hypothetical protein
VTIELATTAAKTAGLDILTTDVQRTKDSTIEYAELLEDQEWDHNSRMYQPDDVTPDLPKGKVTRVGKYMSTIRAIE